jgi:diamine N-acetyltransferase
MEKDPKNINLRALEPSDLELLYRWENDPSIWHVSNTLVPFSKYVLKKYIENAHLDLYQAGQLRLIIDYTDPSGEKVSIGAVDLFDFEPFHLRAGVGILIAENEYRQKGLATLALSQLIEYVFHVLQLHQIYCNISTTNSASLQLFERAGFSIIGNKREWLKIPAGFADEYMLQLINPFISDKQPG